MRWICHEMQMEYWPADGVPWEAIRCWQSPLVRINIVLPEHCLCCAKNYGTPWTETTTQNVTENTLSIRRHQLRRAEIGLICFHIMDKLSKFSKVNYIIYKWQNSSWSMFGWYVKFEVPCSSVYACQVKDPTHGLNVWHVVDSCSLLSSHQSTLVKGKNLP